MRRPWRTPRSDRLRRRTRRGVQQAMSRAPSPGSGRPSRAEIERRDEGEASFAESRSDVLRARVAVIGDDVGVVANRRRPLHRRRSSGITITAGTQRRRASPDRGCLRNRSIHCERAHQGERGDGVVGATNLNEPVRCFHPALSGDVRRSARRGPTASWGDVGDTGEPLAARAMSSTCNSGSMSTVGENVTPARVPVRSGMAPADPRAQRTELEPPRHAQPEVYGTDTLDDIAQLTAIAAERGELRQSSRITRVC